MGHLNFALGDSALFLDFCWKPWGLFDPCDSLSGIARSQGWCEYLPPGPLGNLHPGNPGSLNETTVPKQERRLTLLRNEIAMQSNEKSIHISTYILSRYTGNLVLMLPSKVSSHKKRVVF